MVENKPAAKAAKNDSKADDDAVVTSDAKGLTPQGEAEPKGADKAAEDASAKALDEYIAGVEKVGEIVRSANDVVLVGQPTAGAEAYVEHAQKLAEGEVKYTKDGYVVGVDGVNPVSNENPDPRVINGVTRN